MLLGHGITIATFLLHDQSYYWHYLMTFQRVWLSGWFCFSSHSSGRMPQTLTLQGGRMVPCQTPRAVASCFPRAVSRVCGHGQGAGVTLVCPGPPPASLRCSVAYCGVWVQAMLLELEVRIFGVYFSCGGTKPYLEVRCGWMIATPDPRPEALHYIKRFFLH